MPQLDISVYPSQLFWLIVSFSILYACMHWLVVPRIKKIFQKRRGLLEEKLEEIEFFRKAIEHLEKRIDLLCSHSQKHSVEMLKNTQKECDKLLEEEELKLQKKASESLAVFNQILEIEVKKAEEELSKQRKDFSDFIIQKILSPSSEQKGETP